VTAASTIKWLAQAHLASYLSSTLPKRNSKAKGIESFLFFSQRGTPLYNQAHTETLSVTYFWAFLEPFIVSVLISPMDRSSSSSNIFPAGRDGVTGQIGLIWQVIMEPLIVPVLKLLVVVCLGMSIMLFIERVYMGVVIVFVKLFGKKPNKRYKWEPIKDDIELGNSAYPMVLVQVPMYNEKEVLFLMFLSFCFTVAFCLLCYCILICTVPLLSGLSVVYWSCLWAFLAVRPDHNPSSWWLNRPCH